MTTWHKWQHDTNDTMTQMSPWYIWHYDTNDMMTQMRPFNKFHHDTNDVHEGTGLCIYDALILETFYILIFSPKPSMGGVGPVVGVHQELWRWLAHPPPCLPVAGARGTALWHGGRRQDRDQGLLLKPRLSPCNGYKWQVLGWQPACNEDFPFSLYLISLKCNCLTHCAVHWLESLLQQLQKLQSLLQLQLQLQLQVVIAGTQSFLCIPQQPIYNSIQ